MFEPLTYNLTLNVHKLNTHQHIIVSLTALLLLLLNTVFICVYPLLLRAAVTPAFPLQGINQGFSYPYHELEFDRQ